MEVQRQTQAEALKERLCNHGLKVGSVMVVQGKKKQSIPVCGNPSCRAMASLYLKALTGAEPTYERF